MNMVEIIFLSLYLKMNFHPSKNFPIEVLYVVGEECKDSFEAVLFLYGQADGALVLQVFRLILYVFSLEVILKGIL